MSEFYTQLNSLGNTHTHRVELDTVVMTVGDAVKQLMEQRGENPHSLAPKVKINQPTLYRLITGQTREPKRENLDKLAKFFGVSAEQLGRGVISKQTTQSISEKPPTEPTDVATLIMDEVSAMDLKQQIELYVLIKGMQAKDPPAPIKKQA